MNFVIIQTDQQRADTLGVYGNRIARTPAADQLAADGIAFDYAFTPTPICGPARASLITGKLPCHHGILYNAESGSVAGRDFVGRHDSLAELLADRGYRSTLCGKWHVGTELTPADAGFEGVYHPKYGYPAEHPHYRAYLESLGTSFRLGEQFFARQAGGATGPLLSAIQQGPEEASVPCYLVNQAIEAIRRSAERGEPFLVRCDFWGPHEPFIIPERYARMYDPEALAPWDNFQDDLSAKPSIQATMQRYWGVQDFTWEQWRHLLAMCYGYTTLIDEEVGRLLTALDDEGLADETAVFFTSDHGGMLGAHGLIDKGPYLYDEIVRVPLLARVPGTPGGRRSDALVYNMDLMPTVLELAGCEIPAGLDAVSLAPVIDGRRDRVRRDETLFVEFHGHQGPYSQRMVRTREAKYVFNAPEFDELYDLSADPGERANQADDAAHAALLREMRLLMREKLVSHGDPILRFFQEERLGGECRGQVTPRRAGG